MKVVTLVTPIILDDLMRRVVTYVTLVDLKVGNII